MPALAAEVPAVYSRCVDDYDAKEPEPAGRMAIGCEVRAEREGGLRIGEHTV